MDSLGAVFSKVDADVLPSIPTLSPLKKSVVCLLSVYGCLVAQAQPAPAVTVACSVSKPWCERMAAVFQEETGLVADMVPLSTGDVLKRLEREKDKPTIDVWWGGPGELHLQATGEGLTLSHKSHRMADLYPWAQRFAWISGYRSVGIYSGILGFAYDTQAWKSTGLPAPQCWSDLMQPALKGRIQMADPRTSGTAYTFLATQLQLKGEQEGWAWLKAFHSQVGLYTRSGSAPVQALLKGEALVGVVFLHDAVSGSLAATEAGAPPKLTAVAPCEGTGYEIGGMSLIRGAPNLAGGKKFYELALSPKVQQVAVDVGAFQTQAHKQVSIPPGVPQLGNTKLIPHKILTYGEPEMRERVIQTWATETGVAAPLPRPSSGLRPTAGGR